MTPEEREQLALLLEKLADELRSPPPFVSVWRNPYETAAIPPPTRVWRNPYDRGGN